MNIVLDGKKILTEQGFHDKIAKVFDIQKYYGKNLDALWDTLSANVERPVHITWINADVSRKNIDTFDDIIKVFKKTKKQDEQFNWVDKFTYEIIP
ncbi:barstar family protein [Psychrobacter sp. HD31]|uniref:barstar family protein n=1 Tax=Psychrobacter sp. HD31 TaxID=3112003 RepID=UPI003DA57B1B